MWSRVRTLIACSLILFGSVLILPHIYKSSRVIEDPASEVLCEPLPPWFGTRSGEGWQACAGERIVTVEAGGRLGNRLWEYASVWALAKEVPSLSPYVPRCLLLELDDLFPALSVPPLGHIKQCTSPKIVQPWSKEDVLQYLETVTDKREMDNILLRKWITLPELVIPKLRTLRNQDFRFHDELINDSRKVLIYATKNLTISQVNITYVGVHVRRTDYEQYLGRLVGPSYFRAAMNHFRDRLAPPVVFVVVSDDVSWCEHHLSGPDVLVVSRDGEDLPSADLALLAACNHSIIDYGTFGVWGALLAGGHTLVYRLPGPRGTLSHAVQVARLLPSWELL